MEFFKKNNVYQVIRITGSQDNILGVAFDNKNNSDNIDHITFVIKYSFLL